MSSSSFRAAVGEVVQQSAVLESVVAIVAWGLAGLEQDLGRRVLPDSVDRLLEVVRRLEPVRVTDQQLSDQLLTWCGRVKQANQRRNRIVHAVWLGPGDAGSHQRVTLKPLSGEAPEEMAADDVLALAADLEALATVEASFVGPLARHVGGPWSVA